MDSEVIDPETCSPTLNGKTTNAFPSVGFNTESDTSATTTRSLSVTDVAPVRESPPCEMRPTMRYPSQGFSEIIAGMSVLSSVSSCAVLRCGLVKTRARITRDTDEGLRHC